MKLLLGALLLGCLFSCIEQSEVEYELTCQHISCPNADDTSYYHSSDSSSFTCTWLCADYEGDERVYVSLSFGSWNGGCWELDSEYVSSGICD